MKRALIVLSVCCLSLLGVASPLRADEPRPNVLLILADDVGWGDMHCYNPHGKIHTPNVDRLAREGMRFTNAHTPAALCAPTRYSMLTGNYPWRGRMPGGTWGFNVPSQLKPGQKTVAEMLRTAGYRTAMFGKAGTGGYWELPGAKPAGTLAPVEWGFDYAFNIPRGHQIHPYIFCENGVAVGKINGQGVGAAADDWDVSKVGGRLLERANFFLDDVAAREKASGKPQPFYMHFCCDGAHAPCVPAAKLAGERLKGASKMTQHTDMVYETDLLVGALLSTLEKRGKLENTLVVYCSDNGGLPFEREYGHDAVAGLRGRKSYIFEGGQRVPYVFRWGNKIPAGSVRTQVVGTHDLVATALELAGVEVPQDQALDSRSLVPVLLGKRDDTKPVRECLLVQSSPGAGAFDDGGFRATRTNKGARDDSEVEPSKTKKKKKEKGHENLPMAHAILRGEYKVVFDVNDKPAAVYNLTKDLAEEKNLIGEEKQIERVAKFAAMYEKIRNSKRSIAVRDNGDAAAPAGK